LGNNSWRSGLRKKERFQVPGMAEEKGGHMLSEECPPIWLGSSLNSESERKGAVR